MTKIEKLLEKEFESALKSSSLSYYSLSKPYMREDEAGYDSVYTNALFKGWKLAKGKL